MTDDGGFEPCLCDTCDPLAVIVPAKGDFLVRDGRVIEAIEVEMKESTGDHWGYLVWVEPELEEDGDD